MRRREATLGAAGWLLAGCAVPPRPAQDTPAAGPSAPAGASGPAAAPAARLAQPPAFSTAPPGGAPPGWTLHARPGRAATDYRVVLHEGRAVLQAQARAGAAVLRCALDADPQAAPWLGWQWRTDAIIAGATIADPARDDAPLRVMVAFGATRLVDAWDGMAALEKTVVHPGPARVHSLVVESGGLRTGQWLAYRRHLVDDHRRAFGEPPGRITAIELMTDADDLSGEALAWYGDVTLSA